MSGLSTPRRSSLTTRLAAHIPARVAPSGAVVRVALTSHAVERFIERVHPGCDQAGATAYITALFSMGVVEPHPPPWHVTLRPAPLYLTIGDVALVLDVDVRARDRLVARTCVARDGRWTHRRPRARIRPPKLGRTPRPYRRPAPGQLILDPQH
jgi:hypothetical protein